MKTTVAKIITITCLTMASVSLSAQSIRVVTPNDSIHLNYLLDQSDSLLKAGKSEMALHHARTALELARRKDDTRTEAEALVRIGRVWARRGLNRKALAMYSKSMMMKWANHDRYKMADLYQDMARAFVSTKRYPQALKYHYKAINLFERRDSINLGNKYIQPLWTRSSTDMDSMDLTNIRRFYTLCDSDFVSEGDTIDVLEKEAPSAAISNDQITQYFSDGKRAVAYGLMLHVKQPAPGKRKTFVRISVVGHVFVTLIKFNADCSTTSRSFGFYPRRTRLLSATPFRPSDLSTFKNDMRHGWDEMVGKLITKKKFEGILQLVASYKNKKYHLCTNNCTDFGLDAIQIAGIKINNTVGSWPLGKGNNPGYTGESILEGDLQDDNVSSLFIINKVKKKKCRFK